MQCRADRESFQRASVPLVVFLDSPALELGATSLSPQSATFLRELQPCGVRPQPRCTLFGDWPRTFLAAVSPVLFVQLTHAYPMMPSVARPPLHLYHGRPIAGLLQGGVRKETGLKPGHELSLRAQNSETQN